MVSWLSNLFGSSSSSDTEPITDKQVRKGLLLNESGSECLKIDDEFKIEGRGTVYTGVVVAETIRVGDVVKLVSYEGASRVGKVSGLEMFNKELTEAKTGDHAGVLISFTS